MRLEIANPSDKATIDCANLLAAHIAVVFLSHGKYGIIDDDGDNGMPVFLFGGHDEFFKNKHGGTFEQCIYKCPKEEIAKALKSVELDGERTSLNDIRGRAQQLAEAFLRANAEVSRPAAADGGQP